MRKPWIQIRALCVLQKAEIDIHFDFDYDRKVILRKSGWVNVSIEKVVETPLRDYKKEMMDSDFPAQLSLIKLYEISSFPKKHPLLTQKTL